MPTYVYRCENCKKQVELVQKISEKKEPTCECGYKMVTVIAPSTFVLKGSGWAKDGYSGGAK